MAGVMLERAEDNVPLPPPDEITCARTGGMTASKAVPGRLASASALRRGVSAACPDDTHNVSSCSSVDDNCASLACFCADILTSDFLGVTTLLGVLALGATATTRGLTGCCSVLGGVTDFEAARVLELSPGLTLQDEGTLMKMNQQRHPKQMPSHLHCTPFDRMS